ncbi:MAG: hypothetical protein ACRED0_10940 [Gammaproteobacteria bacterium]
MLGILYTGAMQPMYAADNIVDALKGGKVDLFLSYRFEYVDDGQPRIVNKQLSNIPLQDAKASTLRTALGYTTGLFYDFGAYVQFEDVRVLGNDAYNDGGTNGVYAAMRKMAMDRNLRMADLARSLIAASDLFAPPGTKRDRAKTRASSRQDLLHLLANPIFLGVSDR